MPENTVTCTGVLVLVLIPARLAKIIIPAQGKI